jgi:hypothetical protein
MAFYQKLSAFGKRFVSYHILFKYGFNWSPMYRRTTAKVITVAPDLSHITIKIPLNWKNKNYVGTIFGGSMFSAVDPIPMVQLINLLDENYVVWDKRAEIKFKRPAKETLFADFIFTPDEVKSIKLQVSESKEIDIIKKITLTNKDKTIVYCEVNKTIYVANKNFYKQKRKAKTNASK